MNNEIIVSIKNKILAELSNRNMSIYELAKQVDLSEPCIRNWFNNKNYVPSLSSLIKVCNYLNISLSIVFLEKGEDLYPLSTSEKNMIEKYHKLNDKQKEAINLLINSFFEE